MHVSTYTRGWGFPPFSPHRHPLKKRVQGNLSTKCKQSERTASFWLHHLPRRDIEKGRHSSPTQTVLHS